MNTELLTDYFEVLRDPSVPGNRVARKVAVLTVVAIFGLVYYRHVVLGFGLWKPALATLALALIVAVVFGIFGGVGAAAFYEAFLRKVGARNTEPSLVAFFVEWLFAATSPLFGLFIYAAGRFYDSF